MPVAVAPRVAALAAAFCALALTGCSAPAYRFEASAADDVVVKVPRSWTTVQSGVPATSDGSTPAAGAWLAAWDADRKPSLAHVNSDTAAQPVAIATTIPVEADKGKQVTLDDLRDLVVPVSALGRSAATLSGKVLVPITVLSDREATTPVARGVHVVFRLSLASGEETFEQVAFTDRSKTRIHLFFAHCTTACYAAHSREITAAAASFTVRTP
jgi:hypothetical protein